MPKVCSYPNPRCFNQQKTSSNFIFHSLPRDPELLRLWLTAMSMNDAESPRTTLLSRDVRVCGEHFSPEDYRAPTRGQLKSKLLKSFAVPFTFVVPGGLPETTQQVNGTAKHSSGSETNCAVMGAPVSADSVTLELLKAARATVRASPLGVIETPMIPWSQTTLPPCVPCNIHIKLENLQRTGSFKIRGVANQFARREKGGHFVTMSAGNYGKSFAYASKHYGSKGKVVMPETAPTSRSTLIQSFGVEVERVPTSCLMDTVNRCVQENNMTFLHSYDDLDLIAGHASLGFEVLEKMGEPDVVVVCCGGGGLLAGVAAAIKLSGCHQTRIYGVEPEGACTMYRSFIENQPVGMDTKSIASGLAPPFAGAIPYELCKRFVEAIVLVSDEELKTAVSTLYKSGLVVEPSGSAAFAAIVNNKIPNMENKNVVCILSGGNIGKDELTNFPD